MNLIAFPSEIPMIKIEEEVVKTQSWFSVKTSALPTPIAPLTAAASFSPLQGNASMRTRGMPKAVVQSSFLLGYTYNCYGS